MKTHWEITDEGGSDNTPHLSGQEAAEASVPKGTGPGDATGSRVVSEHPPAVISTAVQNGPAHKGQRPH